MALDYSKYNSIMLPAEKRDSSGVKVTYTYRTNFNNWVLNEGKGHEIEINEDGTVLTIKKFNPHFWILRSPDALSQADWTTAWENWKVILSGIENAVTQMGTSWRVFPYGDPRAQYYPYGFCASQMRNSTSKHPEAFYMYPWDIGIAGGKLKYPNPGYNGFGYRQSGAFNIHNAGASGQNADSYYCSIGLYGVNNWVTEAPETYVEARTASDVTYYEPVTDPIDISDNPVTITLLPTAYTETSDPIIGYQKEIWEGYKGGEKVWEKPMTVENALIEYNGTVVEGDDSTEARVDIGTDITAKSDPIFLDDGLIDSARDVVSTAKLYRYDQINHTSNPSWLGDAYLQYNLNATYKLPEAGRITNLSNYTPYNLCFIGNGENSGNISYLSWLNEYYASEESPFIKHHYDVDNAEDQATLRAEYNRCVAQNDDFYPGYTIKKPFVNRLYLDNDADTPLVINVDIPQYSYDRETDKIVERLAGGNFVLNSNKEGRSSMVFGQGVSKVNNVVINWTRGFNAMPQHFFTNGWYSSMRDKFGTITFNYNGYDAEGNPTTKPCYKFGLCPMEMDNTFTGWPYTTLDMNGSKTEVPENTWQGTDYMYWKIVEHTQFAFNSTNLRVIDVRDNADDEVEWVYGITAASSIDAEGTDYTTIDHYDIKYDDAGQEISRTPVYKLRWPFGLVAWTRMNLAQTFTNNPNLTSIKPILNVSHIWNPNWVHGDGSNYVHAFQGCDNLSEVYLKGINYFNWDLSPLKNISTDSLTYLFNNAVDMTTTTYDTNYLVPDSAKKTATDLNFDWKNLTTSTYTTQGYLKVTFPSQAQIALDAVSSSVKTAFRAKGWKIYLGDTEYTA